MKRRLWKAIQQNHIKPGEKLAVAVDATRELDFARTQSFWVLFLLRRAGLPLPGKQPQPNPKTRRLDPGNWPLTLSQLRHCTPLQPKAEHFRALAHSLAQQPEDHLAAAACILQAKANRGDPHQRLTAAGWTAPEISAGVNLLNQYFRTKAPLYPTPLVES